MKTYCFVQSGGFRGYTRITVSSQEDALAISNLNQMKILNTEYVPSKEERSVPKGFQISGIPIDKYKFDLKEKEVELKTRKKSGNDYVDVSIDNLHVGNIEIDDEKRKEFFTALINNEISSVHVRLETLMRNKVVKSFFGRQKVESEERFKVYLFYKV